MEAENGHSQLPSDNYMPALRAFYTFQSVTTTISGGAYHSYPHFTDENRVPKSNLPKVVSGTASLCS